MPTKYNRLTINEREKILLFRGKGLSIRNIAKYLNRQPSTISRELNRKSEDYSPTKANNRAKRKRKNSRLGKMKILNNPKLYNYIFNKLEDGWSPEQITGRLKIDLDINIIHETIYTFIYSYGGRKHGLHKLFKRHHQTRRARNTGINKKRTKRPNRIDISLRPKEVETRKIVGHWEGDTIIGKGHQASIVTLVERKTKYLIADLLDSQEASKTSKSIIKSLKKIPLNFRKTITFDNGSEFAKHTEITQRLKTKCFFAKPYSSWQRGTNENTNGLIRHYIPKGTDFKKDIDNEYVQLVVDLLNNRPHKNLGYLTPKKALLKELGVALQDGM
jgi:IS30 family transposase